MSQLYRPHIQNGYALLFPSHLFPFLMFLIHKFESHSLISFLIECLYQTKQGNITFSLLRLVDSRLVATEEENGVKSQDTKVGHDGNQDNTRLDQRSRPGASGGNTGRSSQNSKMADQKMMPRAGKGGREQSRTFMARIQDSRRYSRCYGITKPSNG